MIYTRPCTHRRHRSVAVLVMGLPDQEGRVPLVDIRACQDCPVAVSLAGEYHPQRRTIRAMEAHFVRPGVGERLQWDAVPLPAHGDVRHSQEETTHASNL